MLRALWWKYNTFKRLTKELEDTKDLYNNIRWMILNTASAYSVHRPERDITDLVSELYRILEIHKKKDNV